MTTSMGMDRRDLLEHTLFLVGAAAFGSSIFVPVGAIAAGLADSCLDKPTLRLLTAVADTIIPETDTLGALGANVPARFDALLASWASSERRHELTMALKAIDTKARQARGMSFVQLSREQRDEVLAVHDAEALQIDPLKITGGTARRGNPGYADPAYGALKELIVILFYLSENALRQELSYEHSPGEWKPSIPATSNTRTEGGGLI